MAAPRPLRAVALAALLAACGAPSDTGSSGGDPADSSGSAEGIIFKGPMARGGLVTV